MSDRYVEKTFLYLLALSILLHVILFGVASQIEPEKPKGKNEPMMVDLSTLPDIPPPAQLPPARSVAPPAQPKALPPPKTPPLPTPKLNERIDDIPPLRRRAPAPRAEAKAPSRAGTPDGDRGVSAKPSPAGKAPLSPDGVRQAPDAEGGKAGDDLFKPRKGEQIELSKLFPSQKKMASLEEGYRKKYEGAEQGDTRMIDTDDPLIAVYSHRLLVAANESLRVLSRRTSSRGVGVGVLQVTIRRDGSIENVKMVESTKSRVLDDLALTAVRETGYCGPLPKKWPHEKLNLLWIFVSQAPQQY